jgi:pimeloyl-ACP methyl ester carboxylesterase
VGRWLLLVAVPLDLGWAHRTAETIKALRPDAGTTNLDGTSHLLYLDHPDRFNAALEGFLVTLRDGD